MKHFVKLFILCSTLLCITNYADAKADFNHSYGFNTSELKHEEKLIEEACDEWIASKKMYYAEKQTNEGGWIKGFVNNKGIYRNLDESFSNIGKLIKLRVTQPSMQYDFSGIDLDEDKNAGYACGYWIQEFVKLAISKIINIPPYNDVALEKLKKAVLDDFYKNEKLDKYKDISYSVHLYIDTLDVFNMIVTAMRVSVVLKHMPQYEAKHKKQVNTILFNNGYNNCYLASLLQIINALNREQINDKGLERIYDIIQNYRKAITRNYEIDPRGIFSNEYLTKRKEFETTINKIKENYKGEDKTEFVKVLTEIQNFLKPMFYNANNRILQRTRDDIEAKKVVEKSMQDKLQKICKELSNINKNDLKIVDMYLKIRKINRTILEGFQSVGETFCDIGEYFGIQKDKMTKFVNGYFRKSVNDKWRQITEEDFGNKEISEFSIYSTNDVVNNIQAMIKHSSRTSFCEALRSQIDENKIVRMDTLLDKIFDGNLFKPYLTLHVKPKNEVEEDKTKKKVGKIIKENFTQTLQEKIGQNTIVNKYKAKRFIKYILSTQIIIKETNPKSPLCNKPIFTFEIKVDELFEKIGKTDGGEELLNNLDKYGFTTKSSDLVNSEIEDHNFATKIIKYPKVIIKNTETDETIKSVTDTVRNKDYLYTITPEGKILVYRLIGFVNRTTGHYNASIFNGEKYVTIDSFYCKKGKDGKNKDTNYYPTFYVYQQIYDERIN